MDEIIIRLHVEPLEEGVATSSDVPGLVAEGRSISEAASIACDVARKILESCIKHGDPIPPALRNIATVSTPIELLIPVGAD